jgi:hypothetical protein
MIDMKILIITMTVNSKHMLAVQRPLENTWVAVPQETRVHLYKHKLSLYLQIHALLTVALGKVHPRTGHESPEGE